jgi:NAD-dependent deacetylase
MVHSLSKLPDRLLVFTGAGMSAESGVDTFRTPGGIWERYRVEDVATPEAWERDPIGVTEFYNMRREQLVNRAAPHVGHRILAALEDHCEVDLITQNVDDLHERAGSRGVLHLHGELRRVRSAGPSGISKVLEGHEVQSSHRCPDGFRWRPDVVWFGEPVPNWEIAERKAQDAQALLVIGTSLRVYPAASIVQVVPEDCSLLVVDPEQPENFFGTRVLQLPASEGLKQLWKTWLPHQPLP